MTDSATIITSSRTGASKAPAARSPTSSAIRCASRCGGPLSTWTWRRSNPPERRAASDAASGCSRKAGCRTRCGGISSSLDSHYPHGLTIGATGDFEGTGVWTFRQDGDVVDITYDWRIRADEAAAPEPVVPDAAAVRSQSPLGDGAGRGEPGARTGAAARDVRRPAPRGSTAAGPDDAGGCGAARRGGGRRLRAVWPIWFIESRRRTRSQSRVDVVGLQADRASFLEELFIALSARCHPTVTTS